MFYVLNSFNWELIFIALCIDKIRSVNRVYSVLLSPGSINHVTLCDSDDEIEDNVTFSFTIFRVSPCCEPDYDKDTTVITFVDDADGM